MAAISAVELIPQRLFGQDVLDVVGALDSAERKVFLRQFLEVLTQVDLETGDFRPVNLVVNEWLDNLRARDEELLGNGWNGYELADELKKSASDDPRAGMSLDEFIKAQEEEA